MHFHGCWVFHRPFSTLFAGYHNGHDHASFPPPKTRFFENSAYQRISKCVDRTGMVPEGSFGMLRTLSGAENPREEAAKTTF